MINIATIEKVGKDIYSTNNSFRNYLRNENSPKNVLISKIKITLRRIEINREIKKLLKEIDDIYLSVVNPEDFTKVEKELGKFLQIEINMLDNLKLLMIKQREGISNINSPGLKKELEKLYEDIEKWYDEIEDRAETLAISLNLGDKIQKIIEQIKCAPKENLPLLSDVLAKL